jgi:hypothetical protein
MELGDIKNKIKRVYLSIEKISNNNIERDINREIIVDGNNTAIKITWEKEGGLESLNEIVPIIANLANLKDYIKETYTLAGGDKQLIEDEIESSKYLKLIIDLDNREKHCHPQKSRSKEYPYLDEVGKSFTIKGSDKNGGFSTFSVTPNSQFNTDCNLAVVLRAKIKNQEGLLICDFDELINGAIKEWECIIDKYNLIK